MQLLSGHTSPDTAYLVTDYPYGFRLRCQIRYWIEFKPRLGFRLVSQTSNPKRPGLVWNKPKAGTYHFFGLAMYLDENNHVQARGLDEYSSAAECVAYEKEFAAGVPEVGQLVMHKWIAAKVAYEANRNPGDPLIQGLAEAHKAMREIK